MFRAIYTRISLLKPKYFTKYCSTSPKFYYEMPETYQKCCFLANASFQDNINWFYYRGIETAFSNFICKFKKISPSTTEERVIQNVLNKINLMEKCSYIMEMNFPVMKDSGQIEIVTGYCAKHGLHYSKHLGGLRICETVKKSQMKALAALTSFRHICADIPFAGSYSGLKIDPSSYSENELNRLAAAFTRIVTDKHFFGPDTNIFEPDLNCSENIVEHIGEEFIKLKGDDKDVACITGKSYQNGGLQNYYECKANGIFAGVNSFLNDDLIVYKLKMSLGWKDKTYIIKNLDNIGIKLIKCLYKAGAICVGISEDDFGYYSEKGINIEETIDYKSKHGSCRNYFPLYNESKLMKEKCDVLIITDPFHKIDYNTAPDIEAKIIVEASNGLITPTAHRIFVGKGKLVIPDVFINSGTSVASHVEYVKNLKCAQDEKEPVKNFMYLRHSEKIPETIIEYNPEKSNEEILEESEFLKQAIDFRMDASAQKIIKILRDYNLEFDIRTAAYILASEKIFDLLHKSKIL